MTWVRDGAWDWRGAGVGLLLGGLVGCTSGKSEPAEAVGTASGEEDSGEADSGSGGSGDGDSDDGDSDDGDSDDGDSDDGDSDDGGSEDGGPDDGDSDAGDSDAGGSEAGGSEAGGSEAGGSEEECNGLDDDGDGDIDEEVCPDEVVTDPATGRAYLVVGTPMMWFEAAAYCSTYGYQLATIDDETENRTVWELLFAGEDGLSTANAHTWIGLHEDVGGSWEWAAGEPVAYTAWSGEVITDDYGTSTYGQAAAIGDDASAEWFEAPQTWVHHALCESP